MRITDVKTHVLEAKLSEPFAWSFNSTAIRGACLVEIICEDGTIGWGECFGPAALNAAIVAAFRPHLVGTDPLASDGIWMHLYNLFRDQGQRASRSRRSPASTWRCGTSKASTSARRCTC